MGYVTNPFRYCGEYLDRETSTYYLRARNYSPATGRFSSEDPIRDGLNWYVYCNSNPILFIDPTGKKPAQPDGVSDEVYQKYLDSFCIVNKGAGKDSYPAYSDLNADQRAAYNNTIYANKPVELWLIGRDTWTDWKNYPYYNGTQNAHGGNDIAAPAGTEIYSVYYGVASVKIQTDKNGNITGGGQYVAVTSNINGKEVVISYMHMSAFAIQNGDTVAPGTVIGYVGSTGTSSGNHLHFQVGFSSYIEDPFLYLPQEPKR